MSAGIRDCDGAGANKGDQKRAAHATGVSNQQSCCSDPERGAVSAERPAGDSKSMYTCPMHWEVEQVGPGDCPICGMDLEPKYANEEGTGDDKSCRGRCCTDGLVSYLVQCLLPQR